MTRTPQETFTHHAQALAAGDLEQLVADYADNAVLITPRGVVRGRDGVRAAFVQLFDDLPDATWHLKTQIYEDDVLFLEWTAESAGNRLAEGVDTFVFQGGMIRAQTVRYSVRSKT
ncbi:nuclear transport factor 2 family protein [Mycobacterium botniense]|uniref:SnoaL-like domain-containing protein n=1 Tax=Mycobacterium botniense TaxID=84962 RepID=A0A7I9XW89_9MYCO|nr:nuclear transport factor 2 family protein [Mycobacterium botniense]GFG74053.1 hypothetical protein MBOT_14180 [Mycobacterium botniense]